MGECWKRVMARWDLLPVGLVSRVCKCGDVLHSIHKIYGYRIHLSLSRLLLEHSPKMATIESQAFRNSSVLTPAASTVTLSNEKGRLVKKLVMAALMVEEMNGS